MINDLILSGKTLENLETSERPIENNAFQNMGKGRIDSLKEAISEIEFLIDERESLSNVICREIDKMKNEIENFLLSTNSIDLSNMTKDDLFRERSGLRQKQVEVSEFQMNERINCWRDVAQLKKELREMQKELNEKAERANVLGKILEDSE